jgi:Family of unknown function (DUF6588)
MNKNNLLRGIMLNGMAVCLTIFIISTAAAQNPFEDAVKQLNSDNVKGYLQPWVTSFGSNLNSGFYHTANISTLGLTVRIDLIGMGTFIGDKQKKYKTTNPFDGTPVETASIFGEMGTIVSPDSLVLYQFQNGQVKTSFIPFAVPQITIGDLYGTQGIFRYIQLPEMNNIPKLSLIGFGARHSVSRYLPTVPVDLSAGLYFQSLKIGELFKASTFAFSAQVSKTFAIITLYGGLQYESTSMDISYRYQGTLPGYVPADPKITLTVDGKNVVRGTAGFNLNLLALNIFADIGVGDAVTASGGIGFGF